MKIVALYKVWSGEEWLKPSVESIIDHVEKVVLLYSNVSWIGGTGNPSMGVIKDLTNKYPGKVIALRKDESNQLKHCEYGFQYIKSNIPCDYVQLIDSDEVWDNKEYEKAKEFLIKKPGYHTYRTQMYTYIKKATYRVDPLEGLKPVCFVDSKIPTLGNQPRACNLPTTTMPDVYCHHFVFVRTTFNQVLEKLVQSHVSEKQLYQQMDKWIPEVWNKLPNYNRIMFRDGLHPAIGFGASWRNLKVISAKELPTILERYKYIYDFGS